MGVLATDLFFLFRTRRIDPSGPVRGVLPLCETAQQPKGGAPLRPRRAEVYECCQYSTPSTCGYGTCSTQVNSEVPHLTRLPRVFNPGPSLTPTATGFLRHSSSHKNCSKWNNKAFCRNSVAVPVFGAPYSVRRGRVGQTYCSMLRRFGRVANRSKSITCVCCCAVYTC